MGGLSNLGLMKLSMSAFAPEMGSNIMQQSRRTSLGAESTLFPAGIPNSTAMAAYINDKSLHTTDSKTGVAIYTLDEKRRAVLAEVDNARFSHVFLIIAVSSPLTCCPTIAGFTSRSPWLPVSVSSQMRESGSVYSHTEHLSLMVSVSYDIFDINIASTMLGYIYNPQGKLSTNQDLGVKVATPVGNVIGQLLFGWLADVVGRKRMCRVFSILVFVSFTR